MHPGKSTGALTWAIKLTLGVRARVGMSRESCMGVASACEYGARM